MNRNRLRRVAPALISTVLVAVLALGGLTVDHAHAQVVPLAVPEFTITGAGWGHGIGMSQWGAKGFAEHGMSGEDIVMHYYPGTTIGSAEDEVINVNLDKAKTSSNGGYTRASWRIRPGYVGGHIDVYDDDGHVATLDDQTWTVAVSGSNLTITNGSLVIGPLANATLESVDGSPGLIQIVDSSGPKGYSNIRYRGSFDFKLDPENHPGYLKLVNRLTMDDYLYGVVPRESPAYFHPEALKAQALAARSYALTSTRSELYCTTMDQVYNGHSRGSDRENPYEMHEQTSTNTAVDVTSGRYAMYDGEVIRTFFHSSSGGHTANVEDVWLGSGQPSSVYPYRAGVPSPYEASAGDLNASWTPQTLTGLQIGQKLVNRGIGGLPTGAGVSVWVTSVLADRASSGFARTVDITWSNGQTTTDLSGDSFRSALSLKSTKFWVVGFPVERIEGLTRYETAVRVSERTFSSTAPAVVIASGENFADALAGSALAGARGGSLLLTERGSLPDATAAEIERLSPTAVYVLGGVASISPEVASAVGSAAGVTPVRLEGEDRYETAANVAEEVSLYSDGSTALVASGSSWPDAAALSALAYARGYPILLAQKSGLPESTHAFLTEFDPDTVLVAGGESVLSATVDDELEDVTGDLPTRFAGADRYRTTALIADYCVSIGFDSEDVYIATGEVYADALTGGVLAGTNSNPLLLTKKDTVPSGTALWLTEHKSTIAKLHILGGSSAVSDDGVFGLGTVMAQ